MRERHTRAASIGLSATGMAGVRAGKRRSRHRRLPAPGAPRLRRACRDDESTLPALPLSATHRCRWRRRRAPRAVRHARATRTAGRAV